MSSCHNDVYFNNDCTYEKHDPGGVFSKLHIKYLNLKNVLVPKFRTLGHCVQKKSAYKYFAHIKEWKFHSEVHKLFISIAYFPF